MLNSNGYCYQRLAVHLNSLASSFTFACYLITTQSTSIEIQTLALNISELLYLEGNQMQTLPPNISKNQKKLPLMKEVFKFF